MQDRLIEKPSREGVYQSLERKFNMNALRFSLTATTLAVVTLTCASVSAGTIWDGGGANDYWTTGANWNGIKFLQTPPANNGTANIVMPAMNGLVQTPIVNVPYSINSLTFNSGNGRFVILGAEELTIGGGGITNNDADIQYLFGSTRLAANQTWNAAAGPLTVDLVNLNGFTLTIAGAHPVEMSSQISGAGFLWMDDAYSSTVKMTGGVSNTFTNPIIVHGGTLLLEKSGGAVAVPGGVQVYSTLRLGANEQISAANTLVYVAPGGLLDVNTRTETVDRLTIGGTVVTTGVGKLIAAEALVSGPGRWTTAGNFYVGDAANGTLLVNGSGEVFSGVGYIGNQTGVTGEVSVYGSFDGVGSTWTNHGDLYVGNAGNGTLNVFERGIVNSDGNLYVGNAGTGSLNILDGGAVTSGAYDTIASVGHLPNSLGEVVVDGSNSAWVTAHLSIGNKGNGAMAVSNGAQAYAGQSFTVGDAGEGHVTVSNALLTTNNTIIGRAAGSVGTVTLENLALWDHYSPDPVDPFIVGDAGTGTLNVLSESDVILHLQTLPTLGNQAQGHGVVNIDGASSELVVVAQDMSIGRFGTGEVNITDGGLLLLQGAAAGVLVGENDGAQGAVEITGTNSKLAASTAFVGFLGSGLLDIADGGQLQATDEVVLAEGEFATGIAVVDGSSSRLTVLSDEGLLIVGGGGDASLTVSGGAITDAHEVIIADGSLSTGNVLVTGAGSRLDSREGMRVGYNGIANLTVKSGGIASAPLIEINSQSSVHGNGTLQGDVTSFGLVSPGTSAGALHVDGSYLQADNGKLRIELASILSFDQLLVTGMTTLAGTLDVALLDGFTPSADQSFDILDWGSLSGTFSALNLPVLSGGLSWNISQLYTMGILSVDSAFSADFDVDGDVDSNDLDEWQAAYGVNTVADADADGDSDGRDFLKWQRQFGSGLPVVAAVSSVPEPSTLAMIALVGCGLALVRQRLR